MLIKGIFGAFYQIQDSGKNIEVTKKDGKTFFIPIDDILNIVTVMEELKRIKDAKKIIKKLIVG